MTRITGTSHEDRYAFFIIYRSVLLRMRNVSGKSCRQNQKGHFMFNKVFFSKIYYIMWKNKVGPERPQMTMWRLRVSRLVPKATNTHFRNIQYRLLLYCNNGRTNAPQFYVRGYTFPLLLLFEGAFAKSDY